MRALPSLLAGAAAIHLTLAALFCTHVPIEREMPAYIWRALALYGAYTGVPRHYDFFAPEVSTQARAEFRVIDARGAAREARIDTPSGEANQRLAMMYTFLGEPRLRAHLAHGWTEYLLRRHPGAQRVEVRLMVLDLPSSGQARAGRQAAWREFDRLVRDRENRRPR